MWSVDPDATALPLINAGLPTQLVDVDPEETQEWLDSLDAVIERAGPVPRPLPHAQPAASGPASERVGVPSPAQHRLHQHDPARARAVVPRRRGGRAPDPRVLPLERRDHGAPRAAPRHRRRRPHLDVRLVRLALRGRLQPLLPRQGPPRRRRPDLLPGPRLPRHLRPRVPRGPADRGPARRVPPGAVAPRRRPVVLPAPAADAGLLGVPDRLDGPGPAQRDLPGAVQQVPARTAASRTPATSTCGRSSATARWTRSSRSARSAWPRARSSTTSPSSSTATCSASTARCAATARSSRSSSRCFRGAGWNVIKVDLGPRLGPAARRRHRRRARQPDEHTRPTATTRRTRPRTARSSASTSSAATRAPARWSRTWTDDEIWTLQRGGHDYRKLYAAYKAATEHTGQPTVILAKTIKGWTLGSHFEGRNATHQMKKLTLDDLQGLPRPAADPDRRRRSSTRSCRRTTTRAPDSDVHRSTCTSGAARSAATVPEPPGRTPSR